MLLICQTCGHCRGHAKRLMLIVYDGTVTPPLVDNSDKEANATINMEHATFIAQSEGKTTGPAAMMMGKLKIASNMPAALAFQSITDQVQKTHRKS